jgi:hypothetical protein
MTVFDTLLVLGGIELALGDEDMPVLFADQNVGLAVVVEHLADGVALEVVVEHD